MLIMKLLGDDRHEDLLQKKLGFTSSGKKQLLLQTKDADAAQVELVETNNMDLNLFCAVLLRYYNSTFPTTS
jgi:hypothetical protein